MTARRDIASLQKSPPRARYLPFLQKKTKKIEEICENPLTKSKKSCII